jgi:isopenicillin-N N-acyltransferase-like protein
MRVVRVAGSHYEIGKSCGEQCAEDLREKLRVVGWPERYGGEEHRAVLKRVERNFRRLAPDLWAELEGVADGSGVPLPDVVALNCISSLQRAAGFPPPQGQPGCTGLAFADTPDGAIVGKTNDGGSNADDDIPHLITFPNGRRALFFSWPGTVWAWSWVNDAGLVSNGSSVSSNHLNPDGLPGQVLGRLALEHCETVAQAAELYRETPIICEAVAYTMGDAQGNVAAIEQDIGRQAIREPQDGAVFTTNAWFAPELVADNSTDPAREAVIANSRDRFANLQRLVREVPHTVEGMQTILRDHTRPGAICQHLEDNGVYNTYNAFIMLSRARAILVTGAKACEAQFQRIELAECCKT